MRIAFLATADNIHTRRWAEFLQSRGHDVAIFCDPPVKNPPDGLPLIHPEMRLVTKLLAFKLFPKPYGNNFYKRFCYKREIARFRPDVVHAFEALGYGYALARCGPYPKVLTPWGNDVLYDPQKSRIARFLVTRALRAADAITTNHPGLASVLEEKYGVAPSKVDAFSWGVDLDVFHPGRENEVAALRERYELPAGSKIMLSPRMMKPYWGVELIARAGARAMKDISDLRAVFIRGAGDATYENKIRSLLAKEGVLDRCRFVKDYQRPAEMAAWFNLADCFVSCPETDLLSISVLEGLACGCAPILSELEAYKNRVTHGENGLFFEPGSEDDLAENLEIFFHDSLMKIRFAEKNVALAREKDDWKKNAKRLEEIYNRLVKP